MSSAIFYSSSKRLTQNTIFPSVHVTLSFSNNPLIYILVYEIIEFFEWRSLYRVRFLTSIHSLIRLEDSISIGYNIQMNVYRIVVYLSKNFELCESSSLLTIDSCFNRYRYSIVRSLDFQNLLTPSSNLHIFEILRCIDKYYNDFNHRYICRYLTFEHF